MKTQFLSLVLASTVCVASPLLAVPAVFVPTHNPVQALGGGDQWHVITDNNANASYQLESQMVQVLPPAAASLIVTYDITVAPGGQIALGLLNEQRNGWYGNEVVLGPGHHQAAFTEPVPSGEHATLVIRNYHLAAAGQSTFFTHTVDIAQP